MKIEKKHEIIALLRIVFEVYINEHIYMCVYKYILTLNVDRIENVKEYGKPRTNIVNYDI